WILITSDLLRGFTVLGFLLVREAEQVWLVYVLTAVQLALSGFYFPARGAILPDIVDEKELGTANALSSATWSVMLAMGAALGGFVAGQWGNYTAFTIDAITFFISASSISLITLHANHNATADHTVAAALQEYLNGLRYLGQHREVLATALHKIAIMLFTGAAFDVIQVRIAETIFAVGKEGSVGLGWLFAFTGIGTGIGPMLARYFVGDKPRSLRRAIFTGYVVGAIGIAIVSPMVNFPVILFGTLIRGLGVGLIWVFSTQLLLQMVPGKVLGRVFATEFALMTLGGATGATTIGLLLDSSLSLTGILLGMAALLLVPGTVWLAWLRRQEKREQVQA
ncbi:MAG: MFS transporter, partial [Anaerolineales bacterium]|nr:MFS transporter [Anaerolineales bacterium]